MTELIRIEEKEGIQTVNARELHGFLKVKRDFSSWIKQRIEKYDFSKSIDYSVITETGENLFGGRPAIEYHILIDMAKELSMVENNEKGKQARKYFIQCEKELKTALPKNLKESLLLMIKQIEINESQALQLTSQAPKIEVYNQFIGHEGLKNMGEVAKTLNIGRNKLFEKLRELKILQSGHNKNTPYQRYIDRGYFEVKEFVSKDIVKAQTYATVKGMIFIKNKLEVTE